MAAPITPQPIPYRACERHASALFKPFAPGSILDAGTRQSEKARLDVTDARMDHFPWMSDAENPGVPFSPRKPRMPSSARAHTRALCAGEPFVIQVVSPFSTQP